MEAPGSKPAKAPTAAKQAKRARRGATKGDRAKAKEGYGRTHAKRRP